MVERLCLRLLSCCLVRPVIYFSLVIGEGQERRQGGGAGRLGIWRVSLYNKKRRREKKEDFNREVVFVFSGGVKKMAPVQLLLPLLIIELCPLLFFSFVFVCLGAFIL